MVDRKHLGCVGGRLAPHRGHRVGKLLLGPPLQRADGGTEMDSAQGEVASELLFWAAGLSSAAAFLALAGRMFA